VEITDVRVFPVGDEKLKAFASIVLDACFMVNDIKVIRGKDGLFISMPSRRKRNGEFKDVAHPLNQETRRRLEEAVIAAYAKAAGDETAAPRATAPAAEDAAPVERAPADGVPDDASGGDGEAQEKSLEEVEREHLNDAFWGVT